MKISNSIGLGMLGGGARLRAVVRNLLQHAPQDQIRIIAAYDPHPDAVTAIRTKLGVPVEAAVTEEAVVNHPEVDWVFIGSWNCFHARQAILALKAGKKVFCEKPLATSLADCLAIRETLRQHPQTFAFGLVLRYSLHYQRIKEVLKSGRIGRIISMEFNETLGFNHGGYIFGNWRRHSRHAGTHLLEKCCHDLDLVNWLLESVPMKAASLGGRDFFRPEFRHRVAEIGANSAGKPAYGLWEDPERVDPFGDDADIFDNQVAILQYANGVRATFHTNCNSAIPERRMVFIGTHGALRADLLSGILEVRQIGWTESPTVIDTQSRDGHGGGDERMSQSLVRTLLHAEPPLASLTDGLCSAISAFGIDQACAEGRIVDFQALWKQAGIDPQTVMQTS